MSDISNAKIKSTSLGYPDRPILTAYLYLDYGGARQSFGGYGFDDPVKDENGKFIKRVAVAFGMEFIAQVLQTLGVDTWENLPGTSIRVDSEHSKVHGIGHYLKDDWFYPKELAKKMIDFNEGD